VTWEGPEAYEEVAPAPTPAPKQAPSAKGKAKATPAAPAAPVTKQSAPAAKKAKKDAPITVEESSPSEDDSADEDYVADSAKTRGNKVCFSYFSGGIIILLSEEQCSTETTPTSYIRCILIFRE
jgi:hypothetical protein